MSDQKNKEDNTSKISSWIKLGVVGRAHGLRGHFFVAERADEIPEEYLELVIGDDPLLGVTTMILESRMQSNRPLLLCDFAKDRTEASQLTGKGIWVHRSKISVDNDTEYLWADLEGRSVIDSSGVQVGLVQKVYNAGASDIVEILNEQFEVLDLAFVAEYFDMNFDPNDNQLRLLVEKNLFDEFWRK